MFLDSMDIANRALQHIGIPQILSPTEDSKANTECAFAYDKLRRAELRRNVWRFAIKKVILRAVDSTTMILQPPLWVSTTTYLQGAVVKDANNQFWFSRIPDNLGLQLGVNTEAWDAYFGPVTAQLYDSTISYMAGELVYTAGPNTGSYEVYMSLQSGNAVAPNVATAWSSTGVYNNDQVVSYSGSYYASLIPQNTNITPVNAPGNYNSAQTYSSGNQVTASDGYIYTSAVNGNAGNDPTQTTGYWTNTNTVAAWQQVTTPVTASSWRPISASVRSLNIIYPLGSGPSTQEDTRNAFHLPSGFLRKAPRDPKAGSVGFLGAPSGLGYDDWEFENDYIVTRDSGPLLLRFVADIITVSKMDDMFCEGLAARIGFEVCEPLTQSTAKQSLCIGAYKTFMTEARLVNGIETGAEEPELDEYIQCRV